MKGWFRGFFAPSRTESEVERTVSLSQGVRKFTKTSGIALNNGLVEMENVPSHIKQQAVEAMKVKKAMRKGGVRPSHVEDPVTIRRLVELLQKPESYTKINP